MHLFKVITVIFMLLITVACSTLDEPEVQIVDNIKDTNTVNGRFDEKPFKWDYIISTDSIDDSVGLINIYPVKVEKQSRSISDRPGLGTTNPVSDILVTDPNIIYVGAAFPESEFGGGFGKEILYERNPIDIATSFPDSYIGEITRPTGSIGYKLFMKEVLRSQEYKNYLTSKARESMSFSCTEFYSYSDIEKAFATNSGLGNIFSAKVKSNSKKTNIKSRLLGQLISKNFSVTMDLPSSGFFKDRNNDYSSENPVFIRSISYGKIALLAIESEYSFEEVKKALEAGIKFKIFSAGGNYTSKDVEILQKSTITIYVISDNTEGDANQYFSSLDEIQNAFKVSYSQYAPGLPIICKGCYTKDHSVFNIYVPVPRDPGNTNGGRHSGGGTGRH